MANTFQFSVANIFHPIETGEGIMALYLALSQYPAPRLGGHFLCGHLSEQMPRFLWPFLLAFVDIVLLSICRPNTNCLPQINSSVG